MSRLHNGFARVGDMSDATKTVDLPASSSDPVEVDVENVSSLAFETFAEYYFCKADSASEAGTAIAAGNASRRSAEKGQIDCRNESKKYYFRSAGAAVTAGLSYTKMIA